MTTFMAENCTKDWGDYLATMTPAGAAAVIGVAFAAVWLVKVLFGEM